MVPVQSMDFQFIVNDEVMLSDIHSGEEKVVDFFDSSNSIFYSVQEDRSTMKLFHVSSVQFEDVKSEHWSTSILELISILRERCFTRNSLLF